MLYFAYGSNMVLEHMRRMCGRKPVVLCIATLCDYELVIDKRGYLNIVPKAGSKVLGVLYELDENSILSLDKFEGVPEIFHREQVEVIDQHGVKKQAWVYAEARDQRGGGYLRDEYLRRVIAGAYENQLPDEYIEYLESFKKFT